MGASGTAARSYMPPTRSSEAHLTCSTTKPFFVGILLARQCVAEDGGDLYNRAQPPVNGFLPLL